MTTKWVSLSAYFTGFASFGSFGAGFAIRMFRANERQNGSSWYEQARFMVTQVLFVPSAVTKWSVAPVGGAWESPLV
jgi:hypothetical protein